MPDDGHVPEFARSLRSLGAARDAAGEAAHDAIFTPLLDARARAARADGREVIALLRGSTLAERIDRAVAGAAAKGVESPSLARARSATARELLEPLRAALAALDARAGAASDAGPGTIEWSAWLAALRRAFGAADDGCGKLAELLAQPLRPASPSRWFGSRGR